MDLLYLFQPLSAYLLMSLFVDCFLKLWSFCYFSIDHEYIIVFNRHVVENAPSLSLLLMIFSGVPQRQH